MYYVIPNRNFKILNFFLDHLAYITIAVPATPIFQLLFILALKGEFHVK